MALPEPEPKVEVPRRWVPWIVLFLMLAGIGAETLIGSAIERTRALLWELRSERFGKEVG